LKLIPITDYSPTTIACRIFIKLHFSPCGCYLHIAALEALLPAPRYPPRALKNKPFVASQSLLSFHVSTYRLSEAKTTKAPPDPVFHTSVNLGICEHYFVSKLPFVVTWTSQAAYLSISGRKLRLYKVMLFANNSGALPPAPPPPATTKHVFVPKETILLPRSARDRVVSFYPHIRADDDLGGVLILGSRSGAESMTSPPIGVYLSESALGGWVEAGDEDGVGNGEGWRQQRLEGMFEEFDAEEDCDLIPFIL
jgi:hypothetical protein